MTLTPEDAGELRELQKKFDMDEYGTVSENGFYLIKEVKKLLAAEQTKLLEKLESELPTQHIVQEDDDIADEFSGKALKHELQENNINFGHNEALDQVRTLISNYKEGLKQWVK